MYILIAGCLITSHGAGDLTKQKSSNSESDTFKSTLIQECKRMQIRTYGERMPCEALAVLLLSVHPREAKEADRKIPLLSTHTHVIE